MLHQGYTMYTGSYDYKSAIRYKERDIVNNRVRFSLLTSVDYNLINNSTLIGQLIRVSCIWLAIPTSSIGNQGFKDFL